MDAAEHAVHYALAEVMNESAQTVFSLQAPLFDLIDSLDFYEVINIIEADNDLDLIDCDDEIVRRSTVGDLVAYVRHAIADQH